MTRSRTRAFAGVALGALLLAGCAEGDVVQRQPETGRDGLQATGTLDGRRVAISTGDPNVTFGDCDPGDGRDEDVCLVARTIDGIRLALVIENPAVLTPGETTPVRTDTCTGDVCDAVTEHAVVDLRVDGEQRRATGGTIRTRTADERWTADVDLRFRDADRLVGSFDVAVPSASNVPPPPPGG